MSDSGYAAKLSNSEVFKSEYYAINAWDSFNCFTNANINRHVAWPDITLFVRNETHSGLITCKTIINSELSSKDFQHISPDLLYTLANFDDQFFLTSIPEKALVEELLDSLVSAVKKTDTQFKYEVLIRLAIGYRYLLRYQESLKYLDTVQYENLSNSRSNTYLDLLKAQNHFDLYQFNHAVDVLVPHINQMDATITPKSITELVRIVYAFSMLLGGEGNGNISMRNEAFRMIGEFSYKLDDLEYEPTTLYLIEALATYHRIEGAFAKSQFYLQEYLKLLSDETHWIAYEKKASTFHNLAWLSRRQGHFASYQEFLRRAAYADIKVEKSAAAAVTFSNLADSYRLLGSSEKAERFYHLALEMAVSSGNNISLAHTLLDLASLELEDGQYLSAKSYLAKFKNLKIQSKFLSLRENIYRGLIDFHTKNREQGLAHLNAVQNGFLEELSNPEKNDVLMMLLSAYLLMDEHEKLSTVLSLIDANAIESLSDLIVINHAQMLLEIMTPKNDHTFLESNEKISSLYAGMLVKIKETALSLNYDKLGISWLAHTDAFTDRYLKYLLESDNPQLQKKAFEISEQITHFIIRIQRQTATSNSVVAEANSLDLMNSQFQAEVIAHSNPDDKLKIAREWDDFREKSLLNQSNLASVAEINDFSISLDFLVTRVPEEQMILRYLSVDDSLYLFALNKNQWEFFNLGRFPNEADNRSALDIQIELMSTNFQLIPSDLLLRNGTVEHLVFVTPKSLKKMPFSAFKFGSDNRYLVEDFAISYALTATDYVSNDAYQNDQSTKNIVLFTDPLFKPNQSDLTDVTTKWRSAFKKLPWSAKIYEEAESTFSNFSVTHFTGSEATAKNLVSPLSRHASILHIATHAYIDSENPEFVGLITTPATDSSMPHDSGHISLEDLLGFQYFNQLIVFSACETMLGEDFGSQGTRDLSTGMVGRGANSVIGTLWKVPDKSSTLFMKIFYKELVSSKYNISKALRNTQLKFMRLGRYKSPVYWAGYSLILANKAANQIALK